MARVMAKPDRAETDTQSAAAVGVDVIAVFGATASGKSAVAEAIAARLGTEVVSADAMQVYEGLPLLTNQPAKPTRLVACRSLAEEMSLGEYASLAHMAIDEVVAAWGTAVVAGGTGLYFRAALAELDIPPAVTPTTRERVIAEVEADRSAAHRRLTRLDPAAAEAVHPNDTRRLVRALELAEGGRSLVAARDRLWARDTRRPTLVVGLDVPGDVLEERIRSRTRAMFEHGVVTEVREALCRPLSRTAEKTLGLHEIASVDPDTAFERIVVRTRRYAAYQRKWMRRIPGLVLVDGTRPIDELVATILGHAARPAPVGG